MYKTLNFNIHVIMNNIKLGLITLIDILFRTEEVNSTKILYDDIKITYFAFNPNLKDNMFREEIRQERNLLQVLKNSVRKDIINQMYIEMKSNPFRFPEA